MFSSIGMCSAATAYTSHEQLVLDHVQKWGKRAARVLSRAHIAINVFFFVFQIGNVMRCMSIVMPHQILKSTEKKIKSCIGYVRYVTRRQVKVT